MNSCTAAPLSLRQWAFNTAPGSHVHLCLCCCCLGTQSQLTVLAPRPTCVAARPTATPDTSIELHTMLPPIAASLKLQLLLWMSSPAARSYSLLHPATTSYSVERNQCRCPYQLLGLHSARVQLQQTRPLPVAGQTSPMPWNTLLLSETR